jgi:hypothetical protein
VFPVPKKHVLLSSGPLKQESVSDAAIKQEQKSIPFTFDTGLHRRDITFIRAVRCTRYSLVHPIRRGIRAGQAPTNVSTINSSISNRKK